MNLVKSVRNLAADQPRPARVLPQAKYLQLLGLLALADLHQRQLDDVHRAACDLLGIDANNVEGEASYVNDHVFGDRPNAHALLESLGFEVVLEGDPALAPATAGK